MCISCRPVFFSLRLILSQDSEIGDPKRLQKIPKSDTSEKEWARDERKREKVDRDRWNRETNTLLICRRNSPWR